MERYGVIDIGSNTIRLVLYRWQAPHLTAMLNKKKVAGLAGYVDEQHRLTDEGVRCAVQTLNEFREAIAITGVTQVYVFATASLRNVENAGEVTARIEKETGFPIRVLSGREEALYDYSGALRAARVRDGVVVDVGGGSTELVPFRDKRVLSADSMRIGSLNLHAQYVQQIVPRKKEADQIEMRVAAELERLHLPSAPLPETLVAVGGTARAALDLIRARFPDRLSDDGAYPAAALSRLLALYRAERGEFVRLVLKIAPDRIHTIVPGLLVLAGVARRCGAKRVFTSPCGVREGFLYAQLGEEAAE